MMPQAVRPDSVASSLREEKDGEADLKHYLT